MWKLMLGALGVVFGDIGTSPIYAFRECIAHMGGAAPATQDIYGILSLIVWALIGVVTLKYVALVLRADNQGEGGILSLTALVLSTVQKGPLTRPVLLLGILGAALFYADGMITPAISVLSAVEGVNLVAPSLQPLVVPLTVVILLGLFLVQRHGTVTVGKLFGPVVLVWFLTLAALGVTGILQHPTVLAAVFPWHAITFLWHNPTEGITVLGAVFLVCTGAEALYADLGHFGIEPIRRTWLWFVLPALVLNYFGQGGLVLESPEFAGSPFYKLAPPALLIPLVVLATAATIIASQAVISGAFSMARQAIQLGLSPRTEVRHTAAHEIGQVYVPAVNAFLLVATILLVLGFRASGNLAAAYGLAVSLTMVLTTALLALYLSRCRCWSKLRTSLILAPLAVIDLVFLTANVLKIPHGGWLPLLVAAGGLLVMVTWYRGGRVIARRMGSTPLTIHEFLESLRRHPPARVPGTAVIVTRNREGVPLTLLHLLKHQKSLQKRVVLVSMVVVSQPRTRSESRLDVARFPDGFERIIAEYGFMEDPDVPRSLEAAVEQGLIAPLGRDVTYILGRLNLVPGERSLLGWLPRSLFLTMFRNSHDASRFLNIPPDKIIEIGAQMEI